MEHKFEDAQAAYDAALALSGTPPPVRARVLLHRASARMLLDDWRRAEEDFKAVLDIAEARVRKAEACCCCCGGGGGGGDCCRRCVVVVVFVVVVLLWWWMWLVLCFS